MLVQQLILSCGITCLLHFQFNMKQAVLIQAIIGLFTFMESGLVQKYFLRLNGRHFGERFETEMTAEELVPSRNEEEETRKEPAEHK